MACAFSERNLRFGSERRVWAWCSDLLRPRWESDAWEPFDIQVGLDQFLCPAGDDLCHKPLSAVIAKIMERRPAVLLALALRSSEIDLGDVRKKYGNNVRLDQIGKMTAAREERFGEDWFSDLYHPSDLIREWGQLFIPLKTALFNRFLGQKERLQTEIHTLAVQSIENMNVIEAALLIRGERRAPRTILNESMRLQLRKIYGQRSGRISMAHMMDILADTLPSGLKAHITASGYSTEDVVVDFLFHDVDERTPLLGDRTGSIRPHLP